MTLLNPKKFNKFEIVDFLLKFYHTRDILIDLKQVKHRYQHKLIVLIKS